METGALVPAALLLLTLVAVAVLRSRALAAKIGFEIVMLLLIGGTLIARGTSPMPMDAAFAHVADAPWLRALAVVWWLLAARLVATLAALALGRDARSRQARLFSDLLAAGVYLTAILIILNSVLDLPVKGLLATSGVIAIVLGLALQNTLADLFSGIAVGIEQPFHVGNRVTIADHAEGVVVEMNWRSIRIQTDGEDIATIPNSIVARSQIINRSVPTERRAASVEVPALSAGRSETMMELARQALLLCPDVLATPAPSVSLRRVGIRTTTVGASYFVASTARLAPARSQALRQIRRLFRHAGLLDAPAETPATLLAGLALFETLSADQIDALVRASSDHLFEAGDVLMEQDSLGAALYVIRAGIFEISGRRDGGTPQRLGRIGPGEYVGEISMMSGEPRAVTVTALTAARALEVPRSALEALLAEDKALSVALERSIRRGLALLDRDDAARTCQPLDTGGSILQRIRAFLALRGSAA